MDSAQHLGYNTSWKSRAEKCTAVYTQLFERAKQTALAQTGIADAYLASGWCGRCGYKRSVEGNCPNCDHWYTHPLITVGTPLALSLLVLLLVGIHSLRNADPGFARLQNGLLNAAPMPAFIDPNPARPLIKTAPVFFTPAAPVPLMIAKDEESAVEKQFTNLEDLRETVHAAEHSYRTGDVSSYSAKPNTSSAPRTLQAARASAAL